MKITLTDVAHGGYAVGRADDGRVVFARFGIPGELVDVEITSERSRMLYGDVVRVDEAAPTRVDLRWVEAGPGGVGGADLQHVALPAQREWKESVLRTSIARVGGRELAEHLAEQGVAATIAAPSADAERDGWGSRTRVEFIAGPGGQPSMFREGSHDLLPVTELPMGSEGIEDLGIFDGWPSWWREGDRVKAVAPSGSDPVVVIGETAWWAPGMRANPFVTEDVVVNRELFTYRVRAGGFWQIHPEAPGLLISEVLGGCGAIEGAHVVELYSGAGMLTQPLALAVGPSGEVLGVEGVAQATDDARANLRDMPWASSITADIGHRSIERLLDGRTADVIVADPPRTGLGTHVADQIAGLAGRIVLVSCDPAAMARDVARLVRSGRRVESLQALDIFPNTHHLEIVTVLA